MNLIADIGNTSAKFAIYENGRKLSVSRLNELLPDGIENILKSGRFDKAIISSVRVLPNFLTEQLSSDIGFVHILSHRSRFPFKIIYQTPETLGTDRIAGVAGAFNLFPGNQLIVIDAGTAITYDFLIDGKYIGGNISPGLSTRLRALHSFTSRLPLIRLDNEFSNPGQNTRDAILAGVVSGIIFEINEYICVFEKKYKNLSIVLTGGDGEFITGRIDHQIAYMPDIVTDGLNYILEYNAV